MRTLKWLFAAFVLYCLPSQSRAADNVVFGLDYIPSGQHAAFYVALDKGFFAKNELNVDIQRGYGSTDAVKRVGAGTVEIGFGDTAAVIAARSDGLKVKAVAMIYANAPYVLLLRRDASVKTPADLVGKTLAAPVGSASRVMFPTFADKAKIDPASVNWLTTDAANLLPVLLSGRAAGVAEYYAGHFTYVSKAKDNGVELDVMKFSNYGVSVYSNAILVRDETIAAKPDVVRRFVKALREAYQYTFAHPQEAAEILVKLQPQLVPALVVGNIKSVQELNTPKSCGEQPWGFMDREIMLSTRQAAVLAFPDSKPESTPIEDSFTNQFLN
jgi:NitT/TauT family transport system substrate-binding protein